MMIPETALYNRLRGLVFHDRPLYAHYGITHRCNLHCVMCKTNHGHRREELAVDQIEYLFLRLARLGCRYLSISGGEPLLREDLPEVLARLIGIGYRIRLLTNAALLDQMTIDRLLGLGVRDFSISLDSLDPAIFSSICGQNADLNAIMTNLDRLIASSIIPSLILINTVVSRMNIDHLIELHAFALAKGIRISFLKLEGNQPENLLFRPDDKPKIERIIEHLISLKRNGRSAIFNSSAYLSILRDQLLGRSREVRCHAGSLYFSIDPSGGISPCHYHRQMFGYSGNGDFIDPSPVKTATLPRCSGCLRPCWQEVTLALTDRRSFIEALIQELSARRKGMKR